MIEVWYISYQAICLEWSWLVVPDPLQILTIVLCVIGSFFFSASETALACCNRFKMQIKADDGSIPAKIVLKINNKYDRALTSVLIGNNIVAISASMVSTLLFYNLLHSSGLDNTVISLISSIIMSFVVFILGDTLPKTIAKAIPDTLSLIVAPITYFLMIVLFPITILFELLGKLIDKIFKSNANEEFTEEDFENIVELASDDGQIDEEQSEIIHSALDFSDTKVKEVFTPKEKMFCIDLQKMNREKLIGILLTTRYSRIPVYFNNFSRFIGVLHVKTFIKAYYDDPNVNIRSILTKPYYVTSNVMLDDLFNGFKKNHTHIALVRDASKNVIGMVTMEDVLEELVRDISEPLNIKGGNR